MKKFLKYRPAACLLCLIFLLGALSSCKFESVAEHESRMAEQSTILMEEVQGDYVPEVEAAGQEDNSEHSTAAPGQVSEESAAAGNKGSQQTGQSSGGGANAGSGQGDQVHSEQNTTVPHTAAPMPSKSPQEKITVTITITCAAAVGNSQLDSGISLPQDGVLLANSRVTVKSGTTVFELLKAVCLQKNIPLQYQDAMYGIYVQKIGPIGEKDCGARSGWTYYVNSEFIHKSASSKTLGNDDRIEWVYVV